MEKNFDVKEIVITVGIYFALSSIFYWIGNKIFNFHYAQFYIECIKDGEILEFIDGLLKLIISFGGFYSISLFALKNKSNVKISSAIILVMLIFFTFLNVFHEYKQYDGFLNYMKQFDYMKPSSWNQLPFIELFLMFISDDIIKIIAFLMALCKIYIKPSNLSDEVDGNSSEKKLLLGYGIIGYVSCVLIFISPYLFIGAIIGLILYQKRKNS